MLKISTRTRYALRALLEMAHEKDCTIFRLDELSKHQNISRKYLENIFSTLKQHRIVLSKVGKNGGFYLPSETRKISILSILEALEGRVNLVNCHKGKKDCERISFCPANVIWNEINTTLRKTLASKNLKDLTAQEEIRKKCSQVLAKTTRTGKRSV